MNETSAETVTNYTLNGTDLVAGQDVATLQEDGKTVILKLEMTGNGVDTDGLLSNNTAYTVGVKTTLQTEDGKTLETASATPLFFADAVKPAVSEVKALENGNVRIKFSERYGMSGDEAVIINGQSVNLATATLSDDTYNGYLTIPKAAIDAATTLESGKSYSVVVSKFDDLAGNTMDLYSGSFTYTVVSDAPTVSSVTAKDEKTLVVKMSEPVQTAAFTATQVKVFKGLTDLAVVTGNITNPSGDLTTWEIALPTGNDVLFDRTKNETSVALTVKIERL